MKFYKGMTALMFYLFVTTNLLWWTQQPPPVEPKPAVAFAAKHAVADEAAAPQVFFSPNGGCTEAAVAEINKATKTCYVQAYALTSDPIFQALKAAQARDVQVLVIMDKPSVHGTGSLAYALLAAKIPLYADGKHKIAHNKIVIIDGVTVLTGSFNWTTAAEHSNAENMLIIQDLELVHDYILNFQHHLAHSEQVTKIP